MYPHREFPITFHEIARDLGVSDERLPLLLKCYKNKRKYPHALLNLIKSPILKANEGATITGFINAVRMGAAKDKHLRLSKEFTIYRF